MEFAFVLVVIGAAIAGFVLLRRRGRDGGGKRGRRTKRAFKPFSAVTIVPGPGACRAARRQAGNRILSRDATILPLPGCNAANCKCHYDHYDDRREEDDRRSPLVRTQADIAESAGWQKRDGGRRKGD